MSEQTGWFSKIIGAVRTSTQAGFGWFAGFFNAQDPTKSMKRMLMGMAGFTLCRCTVMLSKAIAHQIYQSRPVDQGAVYALSALAIPVAALAGVAYIFRKDGQQQPAAQPQTDDKEQA